MATPTGGFNPEARLRLSGQVALRDESFGALAYHYGTRRLVFLKSPTLVEVVRSLERYASPTAAVAELVTTGDRSRYLSALRRLFDQGVLDAA